RRGVDGLRARVQGRRRDGDQPADLPPAGDDDRQGHLPRGRLPAALSRRPRSLRPVLSRLVAAAAAQEDPCALPPSPTVALSPHPPPTCCRRPDTDAAARRRSSSWSTRTTASSCSICARATSRSTSAPAPWTSASPVRT